MTLPASLSPPSPLLFATFLQRHRLAAAVGLSLAVHAALVALARRDPLAEPPPGMALQVRLQAPAPASALQAPTQEPAAAAPAAPQSEPRAPSGDAPAVNGVSAGAAASSHASSQPDPGAFAGAGMAVQIAPGEQLDGLSEVQLRYPTSLPPSATIAYIVSAAAPDGKTGPARAAAQLAWRVESGARYRLELRGPDGYGADSSGELTDSGMAPLEAGEQGGPGGNARLRFDRDSRQLTSSASPNAYRIIDSALDPWSVLMQLASVGRAAPDRLSMPIVFFVGGAHGVATVRFEPAGAVTLDTAIGALQAEHLVQVAPSGAPRMEVWLAPQQHWLPVQLRAIAADGSSVTYTAKDIALEGNRLP